MLEAGDESGIKHIEAAMEKDPSAIPNGCQLIYLFLTERKRNEEALRYRQATMDYYAEVDLANEERTNISKKDAFVEHELADEVLEGLKAQLARYPKLGKAYLVRKVVKHFPEQPSYVIGVISKTPWYRSQSNKRDQQLIDELASQVTFPDYTYIIVLEHNYKPLRKVFQRIKNSEIYRA